MSSIYSLAYITDPHLDETFPTKMGINARENWEYILRDISTRKLENIVFGGDIGDNNAHGWFFDTLKNFDFQLTLGNHDNYADVSDHLRSSLLKNSNKELYYSKNFGIYTALFLDSSSGYISNRQLKWLERKLENNNPIVLFIHHPLLPVKSYVDMMAPLKNRNELENILAESEQKITIFCGHYHTDHSQIKGNIKQVITPASSFQMEKSLKKVINTDVFGYRIIHFDEISINTELVMFNRSFPMLWLIIFLNWLTLFI